MDIRWIKLYTNIFDNRKIKQIEKLPDGDAILVIWLKLLTLAGNINDGGQIYITTDIPYTNETLAAEFNKPIATVNLAIQTFLKYQMIDVVDNFLQVSNWERYQNVESMDRIKEQTRLRVKNFRAKQKQISNENVTQCNVTPVTQCNVTVTQENREEKNREEKKRKDINDIVEEKEISMEEKIPYKEIVDYLNLKAYKHYQYKTNKTLACIKARFNEGFNKDDFFYVIDVKVAEWLNDPKMDKFLRPETLFGNKFEGYLNSKPNIKKKNATSNPFMNALKEESNE